MIGNRLILNHGTIALLLMALPAALHAQTPMGTGFTYQGQLKLAGGAVNDAADFEFTLWDAVEAGNPVGIMYPADAVGVVDGLFTVELDFGCEVFDGDARWLEIAVRSPAGAGDFTTLTPRQPLTATPYALQTRGLFVDDAGNVGAGTSQPDAQMSLGTWDEGYAGPTNGPQLRLSGEHNTGANTSNGDPAYKLLIEGYNNDGAPVYPIYLMDENQGVDFFVKSRPSASGEPTMYFAGDVGIGTQDPVCALDVEGQFVVNTSSTLPTIYAENLGAGSAICAYSMGGLAGQFAGDVQIGGGLWVTDVPCGNYGNAQWDTSTGQFYYDNSSRRYKENITPLVDDFDKLLLAKPMTYTRPGKPERWEIGYIAEQFAELGLERLMFFDEEGAPFGVNYSKVPLYLTEIAKGHRQRLEAKDAEIAELRTETTELRAKNAELGARLDKVEALMAKLAEGK